jgi:hypothetical protein
LEDVQIPLGFTKVIDEFIVRNRTFPNYLSCDIMFKKPGFKLVVEIYFIIVRYCCNVMLWE